MRSDIARPFRKMRFVPLVAATFFMVSGGPYAIEDILGGAGFARALAILGVLPFVWSLPTALMIGELASAIPEDGGFYVWVRRAMGPFWGFQEGWLSLSASIFDMAIYPSVAVSYLGKLAPSLAAGWHGYGCSLAIVAVCCVWNLRGAPAVGKGSVVLSILLLGPFAVLILLGFWKGFAVHPAVVWNGPTSSGALSTAVLVAMWNYMGWDNASTIAQEVEDPQRAYARAMLGAAGMVALIYVLSLAAVAVAGIPAGIFKTGEWSTAAEALGGPVLGWCVAAGGIVMGVGMFNALMMSYTRVPMVMAECGVLPRRLALRNRFGVPWVSVLCCSVGWGLALNLTFERLITIDLVLYGSSLILEFAALVILRIREPELERPFRAGSLAFSCALGVGPTALIGYALYASRTDSLRFGSIHIPALAFAVAVGLLGPGLYLLLRPRSAAICVSEPGD